MSDIDKFWIFSCLCVVVMKTCSANDVTHGKVQTWASTSASCGIGLEFRESILKEYSVLKDKTFWIGKAIYNKTSDWIEILGCYEVTDGSGSTTLREISSVGECQIKCKSIKSIPINYFGYNTRTNDVCICFEKLPLAKQNITVCKDKLSATAYFIYQVYNETITGHGEHCSTLSCQGGNNHIRAASCSIKDNSIAGKCENGPRTGNIPWGNTYLNSLHTCMSKGLLLLAPLQYCTKDGRKYENEGKTSWTNVFREVSECELTIEESGNLDPVKCLAGQLVEISGQLKLNKTKRDCHVGLEWFMCRKGEAQSTTASSAVYGSAKTSVMLQKSYGTTLFPSSTTNNTVTERKTSSLSVTQIKKADMKTLPSVSHRTQPYTSRSTPTNERISYIMNSTKSSGFSKNLNQTIHKIEGSKGGGKSNTIGAVIGGLLGACSVIALLAVLIVCKVRSIGFFQESTKNHNQESSQMVFSKATYQDSNNTRDKRSTTLTTSNETYGLAANETYGLAGNSRAVYAVVNKIKTSGNTDETYTDAGYGEYDHLHDIQNRRIIHQENLYHSHGAPRNEKDLTYDSSDFGKGKTYDGNGVYDHSFLVVEGEHVYSTNGNHDNSITIAIYDKVS